MERSASRVLLIGGRSHAGKSTVAAHLAGRLSWTLQSTDQLGRHPGRPWGTVPEHVVVHYTTLDDAAILDALIAHQRGLWPSVEAVIRQHAGGGLVLEGSAIMPEDVASHPIAGVAAVWLTGSHAALRERSERDSGYASASPDRQLMIDRFIERNRRLDELLRAGARRFGYPLIDVDGRSVPEVAEACLAAAAPQLGGHGAVKSPSSS